MTKFCSLAKIKGDQLETLLNLNVIAAERPTSIKKYVGVYGGM